MTPPAVHPGRLARVGSVDGAALLPPLLTVAAAVALLALPWPGSLVVLLGGAVVVLGLLAPGWALGVLAAAIPWQGAGRVALGPLAPTVTEVVLGAVIGAGLLRALLARRPLPLDLIALGLALHTLALALSVVAARNLAWWGEEVVNWLAPLLVYLIARGTLRAARDGRPVLIGIALGTLATTGVGLVQVATGSGPASFRLHGLIRAYASLHSPNLFAMYLGIGLPLLLAVASGGLLSGRQPHGVSRQPFADSGQPFAGSDQVLAVGGQGAAVGRWPELGLWLAAAGVVLGGVALLLTQSRGGWIGAGAGCGLVIWLQGGRVRWGGLLAGVVALGLVVATPLGAPIVERLRAGVSGAGGQGQVTVTNFAVQERLAHWGAGLAMLRANPLFGVGAGNFSARFREFTPNWRFRDSRGHAHNAYIQAGAEAGLVGLTTYLLLCGAVGWHLVGCLRRATPGPGRDLAVGAIGVGVAAALANLFDVIHQLNLPVQLVLIWAPAAAAAGEARRTEAVGRGAAWA